MTKVFDYIFRNSKVIKVKYISIKVKTDVTSYFQDSELLVNFFNKQKNYNFIKKYNRLYDCYYHHNKI